MLDKVQIQPLEIFIMNDQPFTCPHCGARCEMLADLYHTNSKRFVQSCLNDICSFVCYEEEDEIFILIL
jgi:hypothetical protein